MAKINWDKPLMDRNGNPIKSVSKILKNPLNGYNMVCVVASYGRDEHTVIYANELTGEDKDGANIQNIQTKLDWSKPLIKVTDGRPCRMVFDKVKTKYEDVRFLILVSVGAGERSYDTETMFVNEYGQNGMGVERVKNKIEFENLDDEDDED